MTIKTPIACMIIILFMAFYYAKLKHLNTRPAKQYWVLIIASEVFIVLSLIAGQTIKNFTSTINDVVHILMNLILLFIYYMVYKYTVTYVEINKKKKFKKKLLIVDLVVAIVSLLIIVLPAMYLEGDTGVFHYGARTYALYAGFIFITTMEYEMLILHKKDIKKRHYDALLSAVILMTVSGLLQILLPFIYMYLGITLLVIALYLSIENPDKYIDEKTNLFNRTGFEKILLEKLFLGKTGEVVLYAINNSEHIDDEKVIIKEINNESKTECYKLSNNVFAVFSGKQTTVIEREYLSSKVFSLDDVDNVLHEINNFIESFADSEKYFDKMTQVFNRNKYEIDSVNFLNYEKDIWYYIVDINNLKKTNDTLGHKAGDILITSVTELLRETFCKNCYIYRIGGDEFVIMSFNDDVEEILKKLYARKEEMNAEEDREIKVSFAIGYSKYIHNISNWEKITHSADEMMYEDKRRQKGEDVR